jgi:hypothetical protein
MTAPDSKPRWAALLPERENARPRKALSELTLEKVFLKKAASRGW